MGARLSQGDSFVDLRQDFLRLTQNKEVGQHGTVTCGLQNLRLTGSSLRHATRPSSGDVVKAGLIGTPGFWRRFSTGRPPRLDEKNQTEQQVLHGLFGVPRRCRTSLAAPQRGAGFFGGSKGPSPNSCLDVVHICHMPVSSHLKRPQVPRGFPGEDPVLKEPTKCSSQHKAHLITAETINSSFFAPGTTGRRTKHRTCPKSFCVRRSSAAMSAKSPLGSD